MQDIRVSQFSPGAAGPRLLGDKGLLLPRGIEYPKKKVLDETRIQKPVHGFGHFNRVRSEEFGFLERFELSVPL